MTTKIQLENGKIFEFDRRPTESDINEVANISTKTQKPQLLDVAAGINPSEVADIGAKFEATGHPVKANIHYAIAGLQKAGQQVAAIPMRFLGGRALDIPQIISERMGYEYPSTGNELIDSALEAGGSLSTYGKGINIAKKVPGLKSPIKAGLVTFGTIGAGQEALRGGSAGDIAKSGAVSAAMYPLYHLGGKVGATATQPLAKFIGPQITQRVGTALGQGSIGAGSAALMAPEGERASAAIKSGILTGGLGAIYPSTPLGKTPAQYAEKATNIMRTVLKPGKGDIKNIEINKGKDLDTYYTLAVEEQLPIKTSTDGKTIDTKSEAIPIIESKQEQLMDKVDKIISKTKPTRKYGYDLEQIAEKVRIRLKDIFSNAKEYKDAISDLDDYIKAEIEKHGKIMVSAPELQTIKKGMHQVGYNESRPTSDKVARQIGNVIKTEIENAYPKTNIKQLNELYGKYSDLKSLLNNAHGKSIAGSQLGKLGYRAMGAAIGGQLLSPIPGIGYPGGVIAGQYLGAKVSDYMRSPERLSAKTGKMAQKAGITNQTFNQVMNPEKYTSIFPKQSKKKDNFPIKTIVGTGLTALVSGITPQAQAKENNIIDMSKIYTMESSNNPKAINNGAYGLGQIRQGALDDYNRINKTNYKLETDMLKSELNKKVSDWYMNVQIPRMLKEKRLKDTIENRLTAYRLGILEVKKGNKASKYIDKYNKL